MAKLVINGYGIVEVSNSYHKMAIQFLNGKKTMHRY